MKDKIMKSAAALLAAGLIIGEAAAAAQAAELFRPAPVLLHYVYSDYDQNGLPVWSTRMCKNSVDQYDVKPGRFYVYVDPDKPTNEDCSLVYIAKVYEKKANIFSDFTHRTAVYIDPSTNKIDELPLDSSILYEVPGGWAEPDDATGTESEPDFYYDKCNKYGFPYWSYDLCSNGPVSQSDVKPGRFYVLEAYLENGVPDYTLIKITKVSSGLWGTGLFKTAEYLNTETGGSGVLELQRESLYEVPGHTEWPTFHVHP